jgi:uncharacterized integral membrane protein
MKRKLKRIGYLVLIVLVVMFIFENDQRWEVEIPFMTNFQMPAYAMIVVILGLGYLMGFLTTVWLRKRKQQAPVA